MNEIASIFQALSLDNSERTIVKLGLAMLPLSYTTLYLLLPRFGGLDFITQAMLSLSLVILLCVVSLTLSSISDAISKNNKSLFLGVFFSPFFISFGATLLYKALGIGQNLLFFIIQLVSTFITSSLICFYFSYKLRKANDKIIPSDSENIDDNASDQDVEQ